MEKEQNFQNCTHCLEPQKQSVLAGVSKVSGIRSDKLKQQLGGLCSLPLL